MAGVTKANPSLKLVRLNKGSINGEHELIAKTNLLYADAAKLNTRELGQKKLVYFTLNTDYKYIDLFYYCLNSIIKNSKELDFDLLIICPDDFEIRIKSNIKLNGINLNGINVYFFNVDLVNDGIQASMNKLLIYKWAGIREYGKVLFLDVDILLRKDINELFNLELNPRILYSTVHDLSHHLHQTVFHKIVDYGLDKMTEFKDNSIYAFNAGQYLFVNNELMLKHFSNVDLISREWSGNYFFEQSFMNFYFNWFCASDSVLLFDKVQFLSVHMWEKSPSILNKKDPVLMHFAGHACDADKKIKFMQTFYPDLVKMDRVSIFGSCYFNVSDKVNTNVWNKIYNCYSVIDINSHKSIWGLRTDVSSTVSDNLNNVVENFINFKT